MVRHLSKVILIGYNTHAWFIFRLHPPFVGSWTVSKYFLESSLPFEVESVEESVASDWEEVLTLKILQIYT